MFLCCLVVTCGYCWYSVIYVVVVKMQEIERVNRVWSTDSMFCKPNIKIPVTFSSDRSSSSPDQSPDLSSTRSMSKRYCVDSLPSQPDDPRDVDERVSSGEEVRSKTDVRRRKGNDVVSVTAECGEDGVKNISDILSCADLQLQSSRVFVEKLAKRR